MSDYDYCEECAIYGDDYFINDDGDIERYCQHCAFNQYEDEGMGRLRKAAE